MSEARSVEETKYLRLLVSRDLKMLAKKRRGIRPGEGDADVMFAEKDRKIAYALDVYSRLGGDAERAVVEYDLPVPAAP